MYFQQSFHFCYRHTAFKDRFNIMNFFAYINITFFLLLKRKTEQTKLRKKTCKIGLQQMESHPLLSSESELSRLPGTAPTQFNPPHSYHKAKAFKKFRQLFFILEVRHHSSRNSARLRYLHTWATVSSCHQASTWLSKTLLKTRLHHLKSGIREGIQK